MDGGMMVRTLYQFQAADCVIQFLEAEYSPTYDGQSVLGYLKLRSLAGDYAVEAVLRGTSVYDWQLTLRPETIAITEGGGFGSGDNLFWVDGKGVGEAGKYGAHLMLYSDEPAADTPYFICNPGTLGVGDFPAYVEIRDAVLVIDSRTPTGTTNIVGSGQLALYWDDSNKVLKGKDNAGNIYTWSPDP